MGYAHVYGPCLRCKQVFAYNPNCVPSFRVNGERQPICRTCLGWVNAERKARGIDPFPPPHPDAYEAIDENEL